MSLLIPPEREAGAPLQAHQASAAASRGLQVSAAEGCACVGVAIIALLAVSDSAGNVLAYRREALAFEPWRVLTCNWVHVNGRHVLLNAVVWLILARLFAPELGVFRQLVTLLLSGMAIGVGLAVFCPEIQWYRGASGTMFSLFFLGATLWALTPPSPMASSTASTHSRLTQTLARRIPWVLLVGGWVKVLAELPRDQHLPMNIWLGAPVVPQAHVLGAIAGALCALVFAWRDRKHRMDSPP